VTKLVYENQPRVRLWPTWPIELLVICAALTAFATAPHVDDAEEAKALAPFFSSVAQGSVTLLVAVALFHGGLGGTVDFRVRRWISPASFCYLGLAACAGMAGSISSLNEGAYGVLFALSIGTCVGGLLTVLLMGTENIRQQRQRAASARAVELDPGPSGSLHRQGTGGSPGADEGSGSSADLGSLVSDDHQTRN
jgi:hypothetical protein